MFVLRKDVDVLIECFFLDDTQDRWQYVNEVAAQFESCSIALGAIKVEDVMVNHLLQYGQFLSSKVKTNFDED